MLQPVAGSYSQLAAEPPQPFSRSNELCAHDTPQPHSISTPSTHTARQPEDTQQVDIESWIVWWADAVYSHPNRRAGAPPLCTTLLSLVLVRPRHTQRRCLQQARSVGVAGAVSGESLRGRGRPWGALSPAWPQTQDAQAPAVARAVARQRRPVWAATPPTARQRVEALTPRCCWAAWSYSRSLVDGAGRVA